MKLLLFSDLHLDAPFQWAGQELARARRHSLRETLRRIIALARERGADALLCGGDLFEHERVSPDTAAFLRATFADADLPVYLAPGNHDWEGPSSPYRTVDWSTNVHIFGESRLTPVELADGLTLWGAGHRAPANTDGFLGSRFTVDRGGVNLALFHGSEVGAFPFQEEGKRPHAPFKAGEIEASGLDHALLGHFHRPVDGDRHTYPGNPDPLSFGETGPRGAVLVTVGEGGDIVRERLSVATTVVASIDVDVTGISSSSEMRERVGAALAPLSGLVQVTVAGEVAPEVNIHLGDLDGLAPHLDGVVFRLGRVRVAYDFEALAAEQTVRGQFVRDVMAAEFDEDSRRRVLVTGLRALDGRMSELEVH